MLDNKLIKLVDDIRSKQCESNYTTYDTLKVRRFALVCNYNTVLYYIIEKNN